MLLRSRLNRLPRPPGRTPKIGVLKTADAPGIQTTQAVTELFNYARTGVITVDSGRGGRGKLGWQGGGEAVRTTVHGKGKLGVFIGESTLCADSYSVSVPPLCYRSGA